MSNLPVVTEAVLLHCGQCEDFDAPLSVKGGEATCTACGDVKYIAHDIAPHVESTEVLAVTTDGFLGYVDIAEMDTDD